MRHSKISRIVVFSIALVLLASVVSVHVVPVHASEGCVPAGGTGLTAKVVVGGGDDESSSGQTISDMAINAMGCDIGVYVSPGSNGVVLDELKISGANDHGIFVQDASHVTIKDSMIVGNGLAPHNCPSPTSPPPCIREDKAVELSGASDSVVVNNLVKGNMADGGIGVSDDGPMSVGGDPGALLASASVAHPADNVKVIGNDIRENSNGCGIVVAGYDANVGVENILARDNTVVGIPPPGPLGGPGSFDGQIVVAGDGPFTVLSNVQIIDNDITGSLLPGIVVHSNVFGDRILNTVIRDNDISDNGWYPGFFIPPGDTNDPITPNTTGMSIVAEVGVFPPSLGPAPVISHTHVVSNTVSHDHTGVWLCGTDHTSIHNLDTDATVPTAKCANGAK